MADIFDEIDEELKQGRAKQVWARYGKYVVSAAAAVVLGVGASQGFTAWKQSQAEASADLYSQAIASDDAVTMLEASLGDLTDGYALLGRFRIAAGKAGDGDAAAAEGVYLEIAADASVAALSSSASGRHGPDPLASGSRRSCRSAGLLDSGAFMTDRTVAASR